MNSSARKVTTGKIRVNRFFVPDGMPDNLTPGTHSTSDGNETFTHWQTDHFARCSPRVAFHRKNSLGNIPQACCWKSGKRPISTVNCSHENGRGPCPGF